MKSVLTAVYRTATRARNELYDKGVLQQSSIGDAPVISVGNIAMGGSGKTPTAALLVRKLLQIGVSSAIVLRGYRGTLEHRGAVVSRGNGPLVSATEAGDEAVMLATRLPGVIVCIGADRLKSSRLALSEGARCIVLDDGFQHRRLHRNLDIVLVRPADLSKDARLFPKGHLREESSGLSRAHLCIGLEIDWRNHPSPPPVLLRMTPSRVTSAAGDGLSLETLRGLRVHVVSGIARPERFETSIQECGSVILSRSVYPDHHFFTAADLVRIEQRAKESRAQAVVLTEKDRARLTRLSDAPIPWMTIGVDAEVLCGETLLNHKLEETLL